jgi:hypothetical protein
MKRVALVVGMVAVAASAVISARGEGVNAFSYIQKGLVACYDGIENAGAGVHDPNATTWVDLTGNSNDGTVGSGITWAANGWVNTSASAVAKPILVGPSLAATTGSETFTMEFTGQRANTARATLFGQYSVDYGVNFEYTANGTSATSNSLRLHFYKALADQVTLNQYTTQATTFRNGDSATLALTAAPTERGLWKNGVLGTFTDTSKSASEIVYRVTTCNSAIGGDAAREGNSQFPFIGTCHAFRLYNRVLTTEELAVNAAVDAVRFRNADPATLTLPAGWSFDAQGNLVKTVSVSAIGGTVCLDDGPAATTVTTNLIQDASSHTFTFTATADAGYEFVGWEGNTDAIISSNGLEVTVDCSGPVSLFAVFRSTSGGSPRSRRKGSTRPTALWHGSTVTRTRDSASTAQLPPPGRIFPAGATTRRSTRRSSAGGRHATPTLRRGGVPLRSPRPASSRRSSLRTGRRKSPRARSTRLARVLRTLATTTGVL